MLKLSRCTPFQFSSVHILYDSCFEKCIFALQQKVEYYLTQYISIFESCLAKICLTQMSRHNVDGTVSLTSSFAFVQLFTDFISWPHLNTQSMVTQINTHLREREVWNVAISVWSMRSREKWGKEKKGKNRAQWKKCVRVRPPPSARLTRPALLIPSTARRGGELSFFPRSILLLAALREGAPQRYVLYKSRRLVSHIYLDPSLRVLLLCATGARFHLCVNQATFARPTCLCYTCAFSRYVTCLKMLLKF